MTHKHTVHSQVTASNHFKLIYCSFCVQSFKKNRSNILSFLILVIQFCNFFCYSYSFCWILHMLNMSTKYIWVIFSVLHLYLFIGNYVIFIILSFECTRTYHSCTVCLYKFNHKEESSSRIGGLFQVMTAI